MIGTGRIAAVSVAAATTGAVLAAFVAPASAAQPLVPCDPVSGGKYFIDGEATIQPQASFRRRLKKQQLRLSTVSPANNFTGRPTFPVANLGFDQSGRPVSRVNLAGGIKFSDGNGNRVRLTNLKAVLKKGSRSFLTAKKGANKIRVFNFTGGRLRIRQAAGETRLNGAPTRLTGAGARFLRERLGAAAAGSAKKPAAKKSTNPLRKGARYGKTTIYAYRQLAPASNPVGEAPVPPPAIVRPDGADSLVSAEIVWRARESFIQYVSSGDGVRMEDGAYGDPSEAIGSGPPLTYSFHFPFAGGWVDDTSDSAAVFGSGLVGFRYCENTINFTVSDPEVELNGDASRLIFRVNGIDGTPFPDSRAVVVGLRLSQALKTTDGDTTTYTDIPGYIPAGSTGVFAGIYPPGDEFGSMNLELTRGP